MASVQPAESETDVTTVVFVTQVAIPLKPDVEARVKAAAAKAKLTEQVWLDKHLRSYFGIR